MILNIAEIIKFDKFDFITIGGATEDVTFYTDEGKIISKKGAEELLAFKYGTKIKIDKFYSTFGGGAANTAVNLANLGFKTAVKVAIGSDARGDAIIQNFKKRKVYTNLVKRIKSSESGFSFLVVGQENEHVLFASRAANNKLSISSDNMKILKKSKNIFISSLTGEWKNVLEKIFTIVGVKIAWNPGYEQLVKPAFLKKYLKFTNVLLLNKEEAKRFVRSHSKYQDESEKFLNKSNNLLEILHSWGVRIAVVTDGKHGVKAYDGKKYYFAKPKKIKKVIDTTGVGDCFGSTFVAGLELTKGDIQKSMDMAVKNVASVLTCIGAQNGLLKRKDLNI
ncbi:carbohydrate kinase family protein [Candidatus Parcubacteria bacterium]|nr:carbohydrate kinase family protein [Candidatus Parcubacteria bacterium]